MFRIYLTNLGKYNEGLLVGEWVNLPVSDDFESAFDHIGINERYEEWFITDYENDYCYQVEEYENIFELNELAEELENLEETTHSIIAAMLEHGFDFSEALNHVDDVVIYHDCQTMADVAYEVVEESGMLNSIPDNLRNYFDYEAYGRDLDLEGTFIFTVGGDCIEVIY